MLFKSRSLLVAATLLAAPLTTAMAQSNNPTANLGSNRSGTAAPGTADSKSASTMDTGDKGAHSTTSGTAMNSTAPGATGRTVVPGSNSSQASSAPSTAQEKTGSGSGTGGGSSN